MVVIFITEMMNFGPDFGLVIGNTIAPSLVESLGNFLLYRPLREGWGVVDGPNI